MLLLVAKDCFTNVSELQPKKCLEFVCAPRTWVGVHSFEEETQNKVLCFVEVFAICKTEVAEALSHCFVVVCILEVFAKVTKKLDVANNCVCVKSVVQVAAVCLSEWFNLAVVAEYFVCFVFALGNLTVAHHQKYKDVLEAVEDLVFVLFA